MARAHLATRRSLVADLRGLGLERGDVVMVHAAVRSMGPIVGGVNTLVQALLDAVGDEGTLAAYVDWENGFQEPIEPSIADEIPTFDKRIARAVRGYGILPEVVRTWPGAVRSDNPDAGVAAIGSRAEWLCGGHSMSYGYGEDSPYAKLVEIGATILIIGAPLDTITLLHHAEHLARVDGKRVTKYLRRVLVDGAPSWIEIEEFDTSEPVVTEMPDDHFMQIATKALEAGCGYSGAVGEAVAYAFNAVSLLRKGVEWLEGWRRDLK